MDKEKLPGSFRDPSGFLFFQDDSIYRQVNIIYKENYDHLIDSGLYETLVNAGLLISHDEIVTQDGVDGYIYKILKPKLIPFISYPYEWCFSQLKDAALATLEVQKISLEHGMTLKDSSAYNIQFVKGAPVFIDTLSFERYNDGKPWVAYRQFCQHFLAPLAIMSYRDIRLSQLLRVHIDGIPLDLASSLLPLRTRFMFSLASHIHLHAKSQKFFGDRTVDVSAHKMSLQSLLGMINSLEATINKFTWRPQTTLWESYYGATNYSPDAFQHKKMIVTELLNKISPKNVWDLGANIGVFSQIAADNNSRVVSFDNDPSCVERIYLDLVKNGETDILPLFLDFTNPSPSIGWANSERMSIFERGKADTALALALVHHLAISNNLPFNNIAEFLSKVCDSLIIEYIPKDDSQVQRLLASREDIFHNYTQSSFENEFGKYFKTESSVIIKDSARILYLMEARSN